MAFTRFHDDPCRIMKQNEIMTGPGRYALDVPGNGAKPCFMMDPHIIPQKWGGNLWTNSVDIQSHLLGIDKQLNRDCVNFDGYKKQYVHTTPIQYPTCEDLTTEQSRTIMPAWTARDLQQNHGYILPENPQAHAEIPFHSYRSTRVLEKDNYKKELQQQSSFDNGAKMGAMGARPNDQRYTLPSHK